MSMQDKFSEISALLKEGKVQEADDLATKFAGAQSPAPAAPVTPPPAPVPAPGAPSWLTDAEGAIGLLGELLPFFRAIAQLFGNHPLVTAQLARLAAMHYAASQQQV